NGRGRVCRTGRAHAPRRARRARLATRTRPEILRGRRREAQRDGLGRARRADAQISFSEEVEQTDKAAPSAVKLFAPPHLIEKIKSALLNGDEDAAAARRAARGLDDDGGRAVDAVGDGDVYLFEAGEAAGLPCVSDQRPLAADLHGDGQRVAPARSEQSDLGGLVVEARGERTRSISPAGDE